MSTPTAVPTFTPTQNPPPRPTRTPTLPPTPTGTRVVAEEVYYDSTTQVAKRATTEANHKATVAVQLQKLLPSSSKPQTSPRPVPTISYTRNSRLVLAHYFAWYDGNGWDNCNISAGDKPLEPYHSDDPAVMARHVQLALDSGLNGFTVHWFAPGDRTDRNFSTLLDKSAGYKFTSSVVFSHHFWHGSPPPSRQDIRDALRYILDQYGSHPNFLRLEDKPVIFFIDVYRVPTAAGETPQQFWASLREQIDPQRKTWWIAEGLEASYLSVFDGLYVFKVSHATSLHDYEKSPRWGAKVRAWEAQTGQSKLWLATISPGWNDLRSTCKPDVRVANTPHRLERANGAVYEASLQAALKSDPDWLILSSFNEWVEGSYIEPSLQYGDKYLRMTKDFTQRFEQNQ